MLGAMTRDVPDELIDAYLNDSFVRTALDHYVILQDVDLTECLMKLVVAMYERNKSMSAELLRAKQLERPWWADPSWKPTS